LAYGLLDVLGVFWQMVWFSDWRRNQVGLEQRASDAIIRGINKFCY